MNRTNLPVRSMLLVLVLLTAMALTACDSGGGTSSGDTGSTGGGTFEEDEATPTPEETEAVEAGGDADVTEVATEAPAPPAADYINKDNASDLVRLRSINQDHTALTTVAYSPTENLVATFGWSKKVTLFDMDTGQEASVLTGASEWGVALEFSPDGAKVVAGSGYAYRVWVWDVKTNKLLFEVITNSWVRRTRWSPDGKHIAVAGQSKADLLILDGASGQQVATVGVKGTELAAAAYSPDGRFVAAGDAAGNVMVFSATDYSTVAELPRKVNELVVDMDFSWDSKRLAVDYKEYGIVIYDTENWTVVNSFTANADENMDVIFGRGSDVLFSCGDDGLFIVFDPDTGSRLFTDSFGKAVWAVSVSGDGRQVALALDDGTVVVMGLPGS